MFRLCWHKWSNWSRAYAGYNGHKKTQYSYCTKCNAKKARLFTTEQQITIDDINKATGEEDLK